eukprot:1791067-Karenia_brevis.AAC.1
MQKDQGFCPTCPSTQGVEYIHRIQQFNLGRALKGSSGRESDPKQESVQVNNINNNRLLKRQRISSGSIYSTQ